jgi:hypothetical protein
LCDIASIPARADAGRPAARVDFVNVQERSLHAKTIFGAEQQVDLF